MTIIDVMLTCYVILIRKGGRQF